MKNLFFQEVLEDPYEIWGAFAMDEKGETVALSKHYIKRIDLPGGEMGFFLASEVKNGVANALTFYPMNDQSHGSTMDWRLFRYGFAPRKRRAFFILKSQQSD